jgi:ABC-type multidrug transport system fused ATPase/permease subunit
MDILLAGGRRIFDGTDNQVTLLSARGAIRASLGLLLPRDRRKLVIAVCLQAATGLLDVIGVLLLGLVATLGASAIAKSPTPSAIQNVIGALGMASWSTATVLAIIGLAAGAFLLAKSVVALYVNRRVLRFLANRQTDVSVRLTRTVLSRPLLEVQEQSSQELTYALTDGVNLAMISLLGSTAIGLTEAATLSALAIALFILNPAVTLGSSVFFGLIVLLMQRVLGRRSSIVGRIIGESSIAGRSLIQEALGTYREIWVLDRREHYADRVAVQRGIASGALADAAFIALVPKYALEAALVVGAFALIGTQFLWSDPVAAIGTVTLFLSAATRVLPSILRLQQAVLTLNTVAGASLPTYKLAEKLGAFGPTLRLAARDPSQLTTNREGEAFDGAIDISDVWLTYPGSEVPAVRGVSFKASAGTSIALVGPSGSGKSTLADLIMGVLRPDNGSALLSGVSPIEAIGNWPGAIAYVPQSVYIVDGTVRANVALGLPDSLVDTEAVWRALARAQLEDFVRALPHQLETEVGENGTRLSGGQQQRLGLARALYTEPRLLVLDEATSSLDAEAEHAVTEIITSLHGAVTTVVIAHRLSTVLHASMVLYLEDGSLISSGTFAEVRAVVPRLERQAMLSGL